MAFSSSDWVIDYTGSTVTNVDSGTGDNYPSVVGTTQYVGDILDFYQWLAEEFSSGDTMQYGYPINSVTPTVYEWTNGWGFGDPSNDYKYLKGGSIVSSGLTEVWSNLYSIGTQVNGSQIYLIQNNEEIEPWWITGNIDILVNVENGGTPIQSDDADGVAIDGGLWVFCREFGNFFDHNFIDLSAGGRNPISINTAVDINNESGEIYISVADASGFAANNFIVGGTSNTVAKIQSISSNDIYLNSVRGGQFVTSETITEYSDRELQTATGQATTNSASVAWTQVMTSYDGITTTFGSVTKDLGNGAGLRPYEVVIDCSGETVATLYEYLKYIVRYDSTGTTYQVQGDDGQEYRNASGTTWTDVKTSPFGTFAGDSFYGARGVFIENMDAGDITKYQLIDSDGEVQSPPIQYSIVLTGLVPGTEIRMYSGATDPKIDEIAGIESSTDTFSYQYTYVSDIDIDIVIHAIGYVYIRLYDFTLTNANSSLPIQQQVDRWYSTG